MDPRIDVVLACNSGTTQPSGLLPPLSNCSSALRSRPPSPGFGPFLSLNTGCGDFAPPAFPGRPNLELRSPRPVVRSLLTATGSRLPPFSAAPEVAVAVVGSTGNIQAHKSGSGCGLPAWLSKRLIITSPGTLSLTRSLSPWFGEEGKGNLARWGPRLCPDLPLRAFQRQVPSPFPQHPFHLLFFLDPLSPSTPPLGQDSPRCLISALALEG